MPGQLNTVSITTLPPIDRPTPSAKAVTTGRSALRAAWPMTMRHSRQALHARHGDELLVHHLEHVGAHQEQRQALQVEGERQHRQGEMVEVVQEKMRSQLLS